MSAKSGTYFVQGPRRIRKGGRFKFDGLWYQHGDLEVLVGEWAYCRNNGPWEIAEVPVFVCGWNRGRPYADAWICDARLEEQ